MAQNCSWRCLFWLPSIDRDAQIALAMLVIFLLLTSYGSVRFVPSPKDFNVDGIDYKPMAGIVVVLLATAFNLLRTQTLAAGDFVSGRRLLVATLATWTALSAFTLTFSLLFGAVAVISPLNPTWLSTLIGLALTSQIPLAFTLLSSVVFKPSTNGASIVRFDATEARLTLCALSQRQRQSRRQDETSEDTRDWNRLLELLKAISTNGNALSNRLKCAAEARHVSELAAMATELLGGIQSFSSPLRNAVLDQPPGGIGAKGRDYFLAF